MRCSVVALVASLFAASVVSGQGVTSAIAPDSSPPGGCSETFDGTFQITVSSLSSSKLVKRQNGLTLSLNDGILTDQNGRTGYIASNYQFQFDKPPQAGAIYTAGFSVCNNASLALGGEALWWECQSGGFYNLYDRDWATHCQPILIEVIGASLGPTSTEATTTEASGQTGSTNVAITGNSQNTNTESTASGGATATTASESTAEAIGASTPALPASGTTLTGGSLTSGGASATGNSTASSAVFSNSTTAFTTSSPTLASTTSSKASSSSASAKSASSSGFAVPLRAQDALAGLGAAIFGLALF